MKNIINEPVDPIFAKGDDGSLPKIEIVLADIEDYENKFKNLLTKTFENEAWLNAFLNDNHHGFLHGNQVRLSALKLIDNLNPVEKARLLQEGQEISEANPEQYAKLAVEISAIFHDSGRFNKDGAVLASEQADHQILSAQRAEMFCVDNKLADINTSISEAILCHDFQSKELTPDLQAPQTIIGQIVQSADQMGWFHPDSINRTLSYNEALGVPFYNPKINLADRLKWKPGTSSGDALTVMLSQLFGPTGEDRFGIEYAQQKVEKYKIGLKKNILKIADKYNVQNEVQVLIDDFENNINYFLLSKFWSNKKRA